MREGTEAAPPEDSGGELGRLGDLGAVFRPRSVAVVGSFPEAGGGQSNWSPDFLRALAEIGFPGPLYPVNPKYREVLGRPCYASLLEVPGPVDHVIASVPAEGVLRLLEDCIGKRVRSIHFYTAGFAETGVGERAALEEELRARARRAGIRIIGPNCMGLYVPGAGLAFYPGQPPEPGPVALISQSGGTLNQGTGLGYARGLRFSKAVSYGNAIDVDESDLLDYLTGDPETEVIGCYVEGVRDGRRFFRALKSAAARKPVAVWKGGQTEAGERACFSHTGALAGSAALFRGLLRQAGAVEVESLEELLDMLVAFRFLGRLAGPRGRLGDRAAVVGMGGGASVLLADLVEGAGLQVPLLPRELQEELREVVPLVGRSTRNPVDGQREVFDAESVLEIWRRVARYEGIDFILHHMGFNILYGWREGQPLYMAPLEEIWRACQAAREVVAKPIVLALRPPLDPEEHREFLTFQRRVTEAGYPLYYSVGAAARAIARLWAWQRER